MKNNIDIYCFERTLCDFESDWLNELLPFDLKITKLYESSNDPSLPEPEKPCVIVSNCHTTYIPFIEKLEKKKINYGVVQLSDETLAGVYHYIGFPHCKFIARNYVHPRFRTLPYVFNFGLGYIKGFTSITSNKPFKDRKYVWGMAGQYREDPPGIPKTNTSRSDALKIFSSLKPNFFHSTEGFSHPNRYTPQEYRAFMNDCQFALCPYGHTNNDTFRIYESLEAGCIPIVLKNSPLGMSVFPSYWHAIFNLQQKDNVFPWLLEDKTGNKQWIIEGNLTEIPFVCEDNWEKCLEKVNFILNNGLLEKVHNDCNLFWIKWKNYWKTLFQCNIEKLL